MPPVIALFLFICYIVYLFVESRKTHQMTSWGLWIPLLWLLIIGTRPVSMWFGSGIETESLADYTEGSPLDRLVYSVLILIGISVLMKRKLQGINIFKANYWLFLFFFYWTFSLIWSDFPFVGFKRLIKDLGNVIMILIVLTEFDSIKAVKAILARYVYIVIPLSVLFIKYYPDIGRYYHVWTWEVYYSGIGIGKNALGSIVLFSGLFLVWDLVQIKSDNGFTRRKLFLINRTILILMALWLLTKASSSTSLFCLVLGTSIILFFRFPSIKKKIKYFGTYSILLALLILFFYFVPGTLELVVGLLGRDITFTGRTDLWADLLREPINPILGYGYKSFWLSPGAAHMWDKYYYHPIQAHNGYLETYLDGGIIGLSLLLALIISTGKKLKNGILSGYSLDVFFLAFFVVILFYSWTEAIFNTQHILWFIFLLITLYNTQLEESSEYSFSFHPNTISK